MIISVSDRALYLRCPWMWNVFSWNRMALEPVRPPALELVRGSIVHHGVDLLCTAQDMRTGVDEYVEQMHEKYVEDYVEFAGGPPGGEWQSNWKETVWIAQSMLALYEQRFGKDPFDPFELIASEVNFFIPIPETDEGYFTGTIDRILRHKESEEIWVGETKTWSSPPNPEHLELDEQQLSYAWALTQLLPDERVRGTYYDGCSADIPRKPRVLPSNNKLSKENIPTTYEYYLAAIIENGDDPHDPYYVSHLEKLKEQDTHDVTSFFARYRFRYTPAAVDLAGERLRKDHDRMVDDARYDRIIPNKMFGWSWDSCHRCALYIPCFNEQRGEPTLQDDIKSGKYREAKYAGYGTGERILAIQEGSLQPHEVNSIEDLRNL